MLPYHFTHVPGTETKNAIADNCSNTGHYHSDTKENLVEQTKRLLIKTYMTEFKKRLNQLYNNYEQLTTKPNKKQEVGNGIFDRYQNPVLTAAHTPVFWRYDLNPQNTPYLM